MRKILVVICCIVCVVSEFFMHLVSFNMFHDAKTYHFLIMAALLIVLLLLTYFLNRRRNSFSLIFYMFTFAVALIYDIWTGFLEWSSFVTMNKLSPGSRSFDLLIVFALVIDAFCFVWALLLFFRNKRQEKDTSK